MLITPITELHPLWPQWVGLYLDSFPVYERVPISAIKDGLDEPDKGCYALAFTGSLGDTMLCGLAYLVIRMNEPVAYLVYLAVNTQMRNRGLGVLIYEAICQFAREAGCNSLFFEVEHPDDPHVDTQMATRRIGWYLRHDAELITGIDLWQRVSDKLPSIQYYIMAHRLGDVADKTITSTAMNLFHGAELTSELRLCSQWPPAHEDRCTRLQ
ncbi:MAG: GNAT family N-acetyltransferase [Armatimonadota bacterium]